MDCHRRGKRDTQADAFEVGIHPVGSENRSDQAERCGFPRRGSGGDSPYRGIENGTIVPTSTPRTVSAVPPGTTIMNRAEIDKELQDMGSLLRNALVPLTSLPGARRFYHQQHQAGQPLSEDGDRQWDVIQEVNNRKIQSGG